MEVVEQVGGVVAGERGTVGLEFERAGGVGRGERRGRVRTPSQRRGDRAENLGVVGEYPHGRGGVRVGVAVPLGHPEGHLVSLADDKVGDGLRHGADVRSQYRLSLNVGVLGAGMAAGSPSAASIGDPPRKGASPTGCPAGDGLPGRENGGLKAGIIEVTMGGRRRVGEYHCRQTQDAVNGDLYLREAVRGAGRDPIRGEGHVVGPVKLSPLRRAGRQGQHRAGRIFGGEKELNGSGRNR